MLTTATARSSGILYKMKSQDSSGVQTNITSNSGTIRSGEQQQTSIGQNSNSNLNQSANWSKIQALKQRKCELEKLLNEKNLFLQQIQKQEAQIIGEHSNLEKNCSLNNNGSNLRFRKKVGTSYKLPKNLYNSKDEGDMDKLLIDKKIQQDICNTSFKLANDPNISKSIRRTHKSEYEAAQQKLIIIHQNLSILKKRQLNQMKTNSLPNSATQIPPSIQPNQIGCIPSPILTKSSPVVQHSNSDLNKKQCNNNVDNFNNNIPITTGCNAINSYYATERRNSMKSTSTINSAKHLEDSNTLLIDRTLKNHCSDYDINRLVPVSTNENNRLGNNSNFPVMYNYFYKGYTIQQPPVDDDTNFNLNHHQQDINGEYFGFSNNQDTNSTKYTTNKYLTTNFQPSPQQYNDVEFTKPLPHGQISRQSYINTSVVHSNPLKDDQQYIVGVLTEKNFYSQMSANSGNKKYDNGDSVSISPSTATSLHDQHVGLGGFWRTLSNNERVWCAVDNSYDHSGIQHHNKTKKINMTAPIKASSLGNFEIITTKDESVDQISISSMNSESSKKTKEKQWIETSLDGPLIRPKSTSSTSNEAGTHSLPHTSYNAGTFSGHQHTISPTFNTYNLHSSVHGHHHPHKDYKFMHRSKLSSQSMSNNNYRPAVTKLEDQTYFSHSTSVLNNNNIKNTTDNQYNPHATQLAGPTLSIQQQQQYRSPVLARTCDQSHESSVTSEQMSPNRLSTSPALNTLKAARNSIMVNVNKISDIRIESPKNMTVIQQATFMPYKEVTKPFEMSDFYKYSTKFRQKEAKQRQTQQCVTAIPSVIADVN